MIRRLLRMFNKEPAAHRPAGDGNTSRPTHFPEIYELLFCDDPDLYMPRDRDAGTAWQRVLYTQDDRGAVRALAEDPEAESRVRLLACRWLMARGDVPASKDILGVIIEVGLEQGNDTLAAYADGSVRYINQSAKLAVFEGGPPDVAALAKALVAASAPTVARIGPWNQPRRPPPSKGDIRLTFLVADGLYFGEGPFQVLANDALARPVIEAGTRLLQRCVASATATKP